MKKESFFKDRKSCPDPEDFTGEVKKLTGSEEEQQLKSILDTFKATIKNKLNENEKKETKNIVDNEQGEVTSISSSRANESKDKEALSSKDKILRIKDKVEENEKKETKKIGDNELTSSKSETTGT